MTVDAVTESPILSLIDEIFRLRQAGVSVLGLHIGEPDFDTPVGIRDAAYRAMNEGFTHYVSAQGMPELRSAIATRLQTRNHIPTSPDDVVVMSAKFAIYATLLSTVGAGDEVLLPDPTYLFEQPVQLAGARPVYVPLRSDFSLDAEALRAAVTPRSKLLILVSPANPTGRVLRREEVRAALEIARDHRLTVVSDETYESLIYDGTHVSPGSMAAPEVPVVTVGSFSKLYAMTGWRAGYAAAPPEIRARLVKVMEHTLTCVPPFVQKACVWALEHAAPDEERFRAAFRERRDHLLQRLARIEGLTTVRPEGAFYVFPRYDLAESSLSFCSQLLSEEKLALVPGVAFGPHGERHLRISYTSSIETLDEGMDRLERYLVRHRSEAPSMGRAAARPF
ncbi:MAG: pyridoxal phosphate-dependent aminotransferase [Thermoplasmata archaeon]|nr:pyridoxal phosphate-dependent aminotransferase [Thermoplasmata archaeon]